MRHPPEKTSRTRFTRLGVPLVATLLVSACSAPADPPTLPAPSIEPAITESSATRAASEPVHIMKPSAQWGLRVRPQ